MAETDSRIAGAPPGRLIGSPPGGPVIRRQSGARLYAADGTCWLDAASGGFGAGHPAVTARIETQLRRVALSSRVLVSRPLAEAVTALDRLAPGPLTVSYLCNSGAEALDAALKLAKGAHPRRRQVLGLRGEDHGTLSHGTALRLGRATPPDLALHPVTVPADRAGELVERVHDGVAAVVLAPAAPGRPLSALSPDWWRRLRAACDAADTLLVLDERGTGPARLGAGLGADLLPVLPDALVLGEVLGADAVPVGCMITTRVRYDRVYGGRNPTVQGSTFGANPLSAAAVSAVLSVVREEDLPARQRQVATAAGGVLGGLTGPGSPVAGAGADGSLVWLRATSAPAATALAAELAAERVLVRPPAGAVLSLLPALTADPADVAAILDRVAAAAHRLSREAS